MKAPKILLQRIKALATNKHFVDCKLRNRNPESENVLHGGLTFAASKLYKGGTLITNSLHGKDIGLVQCSKDGPIMAVLPYELFLELISTTEPVVRKQISEIQPIQNEIKEI